MSPNCQKGRVANKAFNPVRGFEKYEKHRESYQNNMLSKNCAKCFLLTGLWFADKLLVDFESGFYANFRPYSQILRT